MSADTPRRSGILERTIVRWAMRSATVDSNTVLSGHFRAIHVAGDQLRGAGWRPGDKVQIKLEGSLKTRTYTPVSWDNDRGATWFLAYCHGQGPGSAWAAQAAPGAACQMLGPRASLDLGGIEADALFIGDETSLALAIAFAGTRPAGQVHHAFEADAPDDMRSVLDHFGLTADIERRTDGDGHLDALIARTLPLAGPQTVVILTGKATSIQRWNRALKLAGIPTRRLRTKAYWAPGKIGLD